MPVSTGQRVYAVPLATRNVAKMPTFWRMAPMVVPEFHWLGNVTENDPARLCGRV